MAFAVPGSAPIMVSDVGKWRRLGVGFGMFSARI